MVLGLQTNHKCQGLQETYRLATHYQHLQRTRLTPVPAGRHGGAGVAGKIWAWVGQGHHTSRFIYTQPCLAARDVMPERGVWKVALVICSQRGEKRTYGHGQHRAKQGKI